MRWNGRVFLLVTRPPKALLPIDVARGAMYNEEKFISSGFCGKCATLVAGHAFLFAEQGNQVYPVNPEHTMVGPLCSCRHGASFLSAKAGHWSQGAGKAGEARWRKTPERASQKTYMKARVPRGFGPTTRGAVGLPPGEAKAGAWSASAFLFVFFGR